MQTETVKTILCGMTPDEIYNLIGSSGFTPDHGKQISWNLYNKKIADTSRFNKIPHKLREYLNKVSVSGIHLPVAFLLSADNSVKYLFRTKEGLEFETVYIPDKKRHTVCVSTQSGCRMGCRFCLTGRYGFRGNLSAGEIINQIVALPHAAQITHVVFMGMGEPFDNIENVLKACRIISSEWGLAISSRNVTVSTVGLISGVEKFLNDSDCNLTLSLFSPFSDERNKFIPAENICHADDVISVMKRYRIKKKRRLSVAYVMIDKLNDTEKHLSKLKSILHNSSIRVNLLPYHSIKGDEYCSSPPERMQYFKHELIISGISASIRKSRGSDISAACGLLAGSKA